MTLAATLAEILAVLKRIEDAQPKIAYSAREAGRQLGDVSDSHIRTLIARGDLARVPHLGTRVVVGHHELERFANGGAGLPGSPAGVVLARVHLPIEDVPPKEAS